MPCTTDYCDEHDFMVAPGSAWCRMEYAKRANEGGRVAVEMGLAEVIDRMGDLVEQLLDERQARFQRRRQPEPEAPTKRKPSEGGYQWSR